MEPTLTIQVRACRCSTKITWSGYTYYYAMDDCPKCNGTGIRNFTNADIWKHDGISIA